MSSEVLARLKKRIAANKASAERAETKRVRRMENDGGRGERGIIRRLTERVVTGGINRGITYEKMQLFFAWGVNISTALNEIVEKPTITNGIKTAFKLSNEIANTLRQPTCSYFDNGEWMQPFQTPDFNFTITKIMKSFPSETVVPPDDRDEEKQVAKIVKYNGEEFGWYLDIQWGIITGLYVKRDRVEQSRAALKDLLWKSLPHRYIVARNATNGNNGQHALAFEGDDELPTLVSEQATQYASYLRRCIDAGVHRSVMFYGPPGTGKSTMARCIVDLLNFRAIRIRIEDLPEIENSSIFEAISIFQPDVIILDDFDRLYDTSSCLEMLQHFHHHVKLVIATVNDRSGFDQAMLRPQRFDELVKVDTMDEAVLRKILGGVLGDENQDLYEKIKYWPIVYVEELKTRLKFQSKEEAMQSMIELEYRIQRAIRKSHDGDFDEDDALRDRLEKQGKTLGDGEPNAEVPPVLPDTPLNPFVRKDDLEEDDDEDYS